MFEEVPGSFCGTSSSAFKSMGLCFFAFGKALGFCTSAVIVFSILSLRTFLSLWRPCMVTHSTVVVVYGCSFSRSGSLSSSGATRAFIRCCKRPLDNHSCWWYRWFVALVSVAFVALVRKDALDHVIWTSAGVPHPVMTGCHHRLQLLLFHSHQQVKELGGNPGGSPGGPGGASGVSGGLRGTSGSSKKVNLGGDGKLISCPPSFSGVISRS